MSEIKHLRGRLRFSVFNVAQKNKLTFPKIEHNQVFFIVPSNLLRNKNLTLSRLISFRPVLPNRSEHVHVFLNSEMFFWTRRM